MEEILFTKMHGLGNDYIYINCLESAPHHPEQLAVEMSRRHTGAGADGIILILPSDKADFRMRMFNADGSEGKMCGNASRCIARYVRHYGLTDKLRITLETLSGIKVLMLNLTDAGEVESVTVDMGEPVFDAEAIPVKCDGNEAIMLKTPTSQGEVEITAVSMGNPHGVMFIDTPVADAPVHSLGRELECHPMWPDRANIEFARVLSPSVIEMRVWERGSGETMACGTGACATAVAAARLGLAGREVTIALLGGDLHIKWDKETNHVFMTGPAEIVMEGRYFRTDNSK